MPQHGAVLQSCQQRHQVQLQVLSEEGEALQGGQPPQCSAQLWQRSDVAEDVEALEDKGAKTARQGAAEKKADWVALKHLQA